jgi:hypothetical protein
MQVPKTKTNESCVLLAMEYEPAHGETAAGETLTR